MNKNEQEKINITDQTKLQKLFYQEEEAAEKLINKLYLFILPLALILTIIIFLIISRYGKVYFGAILNIIIPLMLLVYNFIIFFLLKNNKYHPFLKYISIFISVSAFTLLIAGYSISSSWIHSLRTVTVCCYFAVIALSGFYHNPKIPVFAGFMCSFQYSMLFFYALIMKKIQFGPSENFNSPTYSMDVFLLYNFALIVCGFIMSYIAKRFLETLDRSIHSEAFSQAMKELDTLKNDFIANITHDFRSPLTVILNTSDLAIQYNNRIDKETKKTFDVIYKSSLRLKSTIDKLLELAKIDEGGLKLEVEKTDLLVFLNTLSNITSRLLCQAELNW